MKYSMPGLCTFASAQGLQQMDFKTRRKNILFEFRIEPKKGYLMSVNVQPDPSVPVLNTMLCSQMKTDTFEVLSIMFANIPLRILREYPGK